MSQMSDGFAKLAVFLALTAGLACQSAARQPAISRAVEVPPPKGWTPDAPLFTDEVVAPVAPSSRRGDVPDRRAAVASRKAVGEAQADRGKAKKKGDARRRALRDSQG